MSHHRISSVAVVLLGVALPGLTVAPAHGAIGTPTGFTVNTQFWADPSPIVDATGPLSSCTSVVELDSNATQISPSKLLFSGEKELACGEATVVIHYDATLNFHAVGLTFGSWYVVSSTLAGVDGGSGTLKGDSRDCEVLSGSEGCILDAFSGRVY